ncbi:hypothetical protein N431DRAFT_475416 [Stipitochalara longipes BDJ]|nr:hypothetical protein N431DRAFT_475416 [Stipitochalara longipes BDJ]
MSSNATVYTGFWTNYARGTVYGSTLTLSTRNGAILIAAIAIFFQLIGGQSWSIICFIAHQLRTTRDAENGLYHQQQAVLRNNKSDINALWQFARIGWAWRSRDTQNFRKSLPVVTIGLLHFIAFSAAGILSSHITTIDDQVLLVQSSRCGPWTDNGSTSSQIFFASYTNTALQSSDQYVQNCLADVADTRHHAECNLYKRQQINWTSTAGPCPFDGMCLGPTNSSLYLDTGLIDSRNDMGINSRDEDHILWRKNATCVPITTVGYSKNGTSSMDYKGANYIGHNNFNYTAMFYGTLLDQLASFASPMDPALLNATYIYTNFYDIAIPLFTHSVSLYDIDGLV